MIDKQDAFFGAVRKVFLDSGSERKRTDGGVCVRLCPPHLLPALDPAIAIPDAAPATNASASIPHEERW